MRISLSLKIEIATKSKQKKPKVKWLKLGNSIIKTLSLRMRK